MAKHNPKQAPPPAPAPKPQPKPTPTVNTSPAKGIKETFGTPKKQ